MKHRWVMLGAVVVSIVIIAALVPYMQNPEIYKKTPAEYTTPFHTDPGLYGKSDLNSSESSLFLMQDMLDISGPLTLNIRISDPESAAEDLARYRNLLGSMDKLIVKIEMSQSDLDEYLATHKDNEKILSDLLNETQDLNRLKELEIQFTDQENPGSYVSVIYQESAIRSRISALYNRYHANREAVNTTASKYGLNTTEYESSIEHFAAIIEKETENQVILDSRVTDIKKSIVNQTKDSITMRISPVVVTYGDTVTIRGTFKSPKNRSQSATMNLDNRDTAETMTGFSGDYEFNYLIKKINSGRHTVYISISGIFSDPGSFTVNPVNSVTRLVVPLTSDQPVVNITGSLSTSAGVPVPGAPVTIAWDRTNMTEVITGEEGQYHTSIVLPNGNHTIQATFRGSGYPVNPSKSQVSKISVQYQVPVKPQPFPLLPLAILGGALVISSSAAVLYLRRRRIIPLLSSASQKTPEEGLSATELFQEGPPPVITSQDELGILPGPIPYGFEEQIPKPGFREEAYDRYWHIVTLIQATVPLPVARSMTTREIVKSCRKKPYYQLLRSFISIYERIRYGPGPFTEEEQNRFVNKSGELTEKIRGDEHP